ncbi:AraC family transcriptional regulator [Gordonia sp. NPDC003504]
MAERAHSMDSERTRADGSDRVLTLDTRELDVAEGRNEWRSTLGSLYAEMDVDWPATRRGLDAEWGGRPVGDLHVSSIRCDAQTVIRSPAMIASDSCADFLVCVVTDGQVEVQQRGRTATLSGGAFALLDLGAPFVFHAPGTFRQVVVRVPGTLVGRILVDLAQTELPSTTAAPFATSALGMLSATILESAPVLSPADSYRAQDLARIEQVIADHLHDADLTLADVAHRSGMSLRNLQKLAQGQGQTANGWLYAARIERAKHLLLTTGDPVAAICERVGFRDVSHFGRLFRKHVGVSPGRFRAG